MVRSVLGRLRTRCNPNRTIYNVLIQDTWGQVVTDQEAKPKKRPGRPATGKRGNFTFRVTDMLRSQLEQAAQTNHLSVSEEIERRLSASFYRERLSEDAQHIADIVGLMAGTIELDTQRTVLSSEVMRRYSYARITESLRFTFKVKPTNELDGVEKQEAIEIEERAHLDSLDDEKRRQAFRGDGFFAKLLGLMQTSSDPAKA